MWRPLVGRENGEYGENRIPRLFLNKGHVQPYNAAGTVAGDGSSYMHLGLADLRPVHAARKPHGTHWCLLWRGVKLYIAAIHSPLTGRHHVSLSTILYCAVLNINI